MLVSTPTGSSAYSLSAGGPLVQPEIDCMLLTLVCPRSLAFRPALLPSTFVVSIYPHASNQNQIELTLDEEHGGILSDGQHVSVTKSRFPLKIACHSNAHQDWIKSVNSLLAWNRRFSEKETR